MRENPGPDVRETDYVAHTAGPAQDTESYYKRTPAPGARFAPHSATDEPTLSSADGPAHPRAQTDDGPGWLRRDSLSGDHQAQTSSFKLPILITLGVAGLILAFAGMVLAIALLAASGSNAPPPPSAEAAEEAPETWQGLRVKKGLR